jgi:hypothetical protein
MRVLLDALQAVALATAAILAGAQIYVAVGVVPAMREFPTAMSVRLHQELLTWRPGRVFKPATTVVVLATLLSLIATPFVSGDHPVPTALLTAVALVLLTVYAVFTLRFEFPINRQVRSWGDDPPPATYPELRAHWDARQRIKMICVSVAFAFILLAVMVSR